MKSVWRDGEASRMVELESLGNGRWRVKVDLAEFEVEVEPTGPGALRLVHDRGVTRAVVTAAGTRRFVRLGSLDFVLERETTARKAGRADAHGGLEAPMPGTVTRVLVAAGDAVRKGQPLVAIEAMKMEHMIRAPREGKIARVRAAAGEMVTPGSPLVELEDPE